MIISLLFMAAFLTGAIITGYYHLLFCNDYYSLDAAMKQTGYVKEAAYVYQKEDQGKEIRIEFDLGNMQCRKNGYTFPLEGSVLHLGRAADKGIWVTGNKLREIINYAFSYSGIFPPRVTAQNIDYAKCEWTDFPKLIAHAGGAVRETGYLGTYTNSLEALEQNYSLGHRVFEIDFYLTSDHRLACVHDWEQFGDYDGTAYSEEKWLSSRTAGQPVTDSRYTTMTIDTLMDEMLVNPDMFIVTDTKSTELPREMGKEQFALMLEAAERKGAPELMNRIIPQIYNEKMYAYVKEIYSFPCIIYTTYASGSTGEEIMSFAEAHEEVRIITHSLSDTRIDHERMHQAGKLIYTHTVNTMSEMLSQSTEGVDGFYTDVLLPEDYDIMTRYKEISFSDK